MNAKFFSSLSSQEDLINQIDNWLSSFDKKWIHPEILNITYLPFAAQTPLNPKQITMQFTASVIYTIVTNE